MMNTTSRSQQLLSLLCLPTLLLLLSSSSLSVDAIEDCKNEGEQPLEFRFFTDHNSWNDNGWTLECDYEDESKAMLWSVPIGSLKYEARTQVIREAACIPDTATCTFHIFDAMGDGLQSINENGEDEEYFSGWFALLHGATTVGTYQNVAEPSFSELTYCIGPNCDQQPQEMQSNDENCQDVVYLALQLDANPQDTTYQLVCNDGADIIWDGKDFTTPGAYVEEETCLPKDSCCEFVVTDNDTNGLTSEVDTTNLAAGTRSTGFIYLEWNYEPVMEYDGATGEEFDVLTAQFACGSTTTETDATVTTESADADTDVDVDANVDVDVEVDVDVDVDTDTDTDTVSATDEVETTDNMTTSEEVVRETYVPSDESTDYSSENANDEWGFGQWLGEDDTVDVFDQQTSNPTSWGSDESTQSYWDDIVLEDDDFTSQQYQTDDELAWEFENEFGDDMVMADDDFTFTPPMDDVVLTDDVAIDDDTKWTQEQLKDLEDLVIETDNRNPTKPDDLSVAFLNGDNTTKQKKGMSKGGKIATGVIVCLILLIALVGSVLYFFGEQLLEKFGGDGDDEEIDAAKEEQKPETECDDDEVENYSNNSAENV